MKILTTNHSNKPTLTEQQLSEGFGIWDITVKSGCNDGWWLAPTWELVNQWKCGEISWELFTTTYLELIHKRWHRTGCRTFPNSKVLLVCYCSTEENCHRYLAAKFLVDNCGATYFGEYSKS